MPDKPTYEELEQRVRELKSSESELKRMLDALQQKENRYQNLFKHMLHEVHVWKIVFDDHGNIRTWKLVDANPAALKSWNKTLPEVIGKTTDEMFPDSNATEQFMPIVEKIYREGIPHRWESYFPDTGQILHMVSVSFGDYFISTGFDITEHKQADETLRRKHEMLKRTEAIAHVGSWEWEIATDTVTWSEELYRIFQLDSGSEAPNWAEHPKLYHPTDFEKLRQAAETAIADGKSYEIELRAFRKDGEPRICTAKGFPETGESGQVVRLFGLLQDITDRRKAEADLRNSEERLRTVIDSSPFPVAFADTNDEKILFWSQSAIKMFGHEPQKVSEWYELAYPDPDYRNEVIKLWKPFLEKTQQTKTAVNTGEYRIVCQNGSIKICEIYAQYIPGNLIVTFNDITERKQTELALKESEERFRAIFESTSDFVFLKDRNLRYVKVNKAMENLFGKSRKEIIGLTDEELFGGDAAAHIKEIDSRVLRGETIEEEDTKPVDDKFYTFHVNKTPVIGENGEIVGLCGIARNITDRKQTEEELKKSEEKYRLIAENMSDVVSILNMDFRFTYASPSIKRLTGLSTEAFINQSVEEIMPPEYFEKVTKIFEEEMMMEASGNADPFRTRIIEFEQYTQDRSTVWVEVSCSFLRDTEKHPVGILAISRDISDRKQAEVDLKRRIEYEQILSEISSEIAKSMGGNIDQAIEDTLAMLCNFSGADRSYIFQFKDNFRMDNTHEFCASGIEPQIENLKNIDVENELPWFMEQIKKSKIFYAYEVKTLPEEARLERAHFSDQEIKSLIVLPIQTTENLIGFVGFDAVRKHIKWNDDDKSLLQHYSHTLCHVIEAQQAGSALQKREFIFSQTFEQSSTSTCFYDPEGKILRVNKEFCKMFGVKENDILNAGYNMFKDKAIEEAGVLPAIREIFEDKKIRHWEINFDIAKASESTGTPTSKTEKIYLEIYGYPVVNYQNKLEFVVLKHYDITKRKQAEERLISLERRNQALLDHSPVCHKIVDLDFNLQYMSGNGFKMLKLDSNSDVYGKPYPFYFFPEAFRNTMTKSLMEVKNTGKIITMEALASDIEGKEVWLDSTLIPVFDDQGKIDYLTVVSANITQRKHDESDKKRLEAQLQQSQKLESIGTLAGGIAHDFNNILSSLIGFTELALDDVEKGSPVEDSLQEIFTGGKRARDLVKQILAFARQSDDAIKPIQIDMIAKEVLKLLRASIPTTIKINQNIEKNLTIMGNPTQFHQLLVNICTNAAQAMEKGGGVLELSIKGIVIDNIDTFKNLNAGEYAEIKISDTGMGIDPEIMDKIFDPYFTTKGIGKGTGMGLALVHGIIQTYNGTITADSEPGKGTVFTVYLPLIRSTGESASYQPEILPIGDERILLVDDESPIVKMSSQILQKLGYMVVSSTSGLKALELFRSTPEDFDLVITDMTMPGITGDKLAAELMSVRRDIPVILCTGYSNQISEKTASDIGIKAFAYKPVSKNDLANTVRKVLDEVKSKK